MNSIMTIWETIVEYFVDYILSYVLCLLGNVLPGLPC